MPSVSGTRISHRRATRKLARRRREDGSRGEGAMRSTTDATLMEAVRESARPLTGSARDYDALMDVVGDARVALLGEASHGTHEFYRERAEITKRLITEDEEAIDLKTAHLRFDVGLLSERL